MFVTPPDGFMDEPMFVYAVSEGGGFTVGNFALLNTAVFVPEPATLLLGLAGIGLLGLRRRRGRR
jgi:hypothetical protein